MICCQFIFRPGTYDEEFHRLDGEIDAYARSLPGFDHVETWTAPEEGLVNAVYYFTDQASVAQLAQFPRHREAKGQVQRWYDGYRIVVSEVVATYGDGRLDPRGRPPGRPTGRPAAQGPCFPRVPGGRLAGGGNASPCCPASGCSP